MGRVHPNPTGFCACTLAGFTLLLTFGIALACERFLKETGIGMLTQSRRKGSMSAPSCESAASPSIAPAIAFARRRGKTELKSFQYAVGCIIFVLEMEDKASEPIL